MWIWRQHNQWPHNGIKERRCHIHKGQPMRLISTAYWLQTTSSISWWKQYTCEWRHEDYVNVVVTSMKVTSTSGRCQLQLSRDTESDRSHIANWVVTQEFSRQFFLEIKKNWHILNCTLIITASQAARIMRFVAKCVPDRTFVVLLSASLFTQSCFILAAQW